MIIDFHTHVVPPWLKDGRPQYVERDPCFALLYAQPKAKLATAEEVIASMDDAGVTVSVILNIGWISHQLCVETNDYILESISRYPDRLVGFCAIQPTAGEAALIEIERCARGGARGIGELRPDMQGFALGDVNLLKPLVEVAREQGLILLTHSSEPVGHQYPGKGTVTPELLYSFIASFPELPLVCAHWGGGLPFYALMPEVSAALGSVYFDTAATSLLYDFSIFNHVVDILGADKILFGTDYPLLSQSKQMQRIQSLNLPDETKRMILGGNAERLLFGQPPKGK